jgi:hypothetical protein
VLGLAPLVVYVHSPSQPRKLKHRALRESSADVQNPDSNARCTPHSFTQGEAALVFAAKLPACLFHNRERDFPAAATCFRPKEFAVVNTISPARPKQSQAQREPLKGDVSDAGDLFCGRPERLKKAECHRRYLVGGRKCAPGSAHERYDDKNFRAQADPLPVRH